jgi:DNA-binding NtrC family response regulator
MDRKTIAEKFGLIAESEVMISVVNKIIQVAPTDITVLLQGESGVGKDVVAKAIHGLSKRSGSPLVIVNCGAIPEGIIESELFGHEKGSFTGAHESREGYFEKANNGSIFLDEIGDTPKNVQVKLLRILENGEYFRVGSAKSRKSDARIITATNRDLWRDVQNGSFREDLFYRLNTVTIRIPPLRDRVEDIIPIFRKFVLEFSRQYDSVFQGFADEARQLLFSYRWPGNIRELRNVAEQLVVLEKSQYITPEILQKYLKGRQHYGSADNLPIVFGGSENRYQNSNGGLRNDADSDLIYRSLIELRTEISELKKMMGSLLYAQFSNAPIEKKLLPDSSSVRSAPYYPESDRHSQSVQGSALDIHPSVFDDKELAIDAELFGSDELPSLEEAEKMLISRALSIFKGNRRKASEALGVSERTLYRKIDQYQLKSDDES